MWPRRIDGRDGERGRTAPAALLAGIVLALAAAAATRCARSGRPAAEARPPDIAESAKESLETSDWIDWLTREGLDDLAAVALRDLAARRRSDASVADRLAGAYLRLLGTEHGARLEALRARVVEFAAAAPSLLRIRLDLAVARSDYRTALEGVDRRRKGETDASIRERAMAGLARAVKSLDEIGARADLRAGSDRREASIESEAGRLAATSDAGEAEDIRSESRFLAAWCRYWTAWLSRGEAGDLEAERIRRRAEADAVAAAWADVLEVAPGNLAPGAVSRDRLSEDGYASSILGLAMTKALGEGTAAAQPWFDLLGEGAIPASIAAQLPDWRFQARVDAGDWEGAAAMLGAGGPLDSDLVFGAVARLEAERPGSPAAQSLARSALMRSLTDGTFGAVARFAKRFPAFVEGDAFAARLARGIAAYEDGRAAVVPDTTRSSMAAAARDLASATATPPDDPRAAAALDETLGWARLGSGDRCGASEAFERASSLRTGDAAEDAMWLAIRCARQGDCRGPEASGPTALALARAYLARFAEGRHAADAALVLAAAPGAENDFELVGRLEKEAVRGDPGRGARETTAALLYRRFRAAAGADRHAAADRLLSVPALPAADWPEGTVDIVLRQQLEAALSPDVARFEDARVRLREIEKRYPPGQEPPDLRAEIALRRLAVALADIRPEDALRDLASVRSAPDPAMRVAAEAAFLAASEGLLTVPSARPGTRTRVLEAIVESRWFLLERARSSEDPDKVDSAALDLAEALLRAAEASAASGLADAASGAARENRQALSLVRTISARRPRDARALGLLADAASASGDLATAEAALVRLVEGLPERSDAWFERKADLCEVLARTNPDEARRILAQHVALIPDWGPGAAGARLRALAARLGVVARSQGGAG